MIFTGKTQEYLLLDTITAANQELLPETIDGGLTIVWGVEGGTHLKVDDIDCRIRKNDIIFLTQYHKTEVVEISELRVVRFNRSFYCILDHDSEVGCKGILFFGAEGVPAVSIPRDRQEQFEILWKMFAMEMQSRDNLQVEMLQMMLKRLLILCTRLFKEQHEVSDMEPKQVDIVREYNFLVEMHFREKHNVSEYAELLFKSPKTLANYFARYNHKTPLQVIQNRIMVEARRLLHYTDLAIKEIAYELGFDDIQAFSRLFRKKEGMAPTEYREKTRAMG
ncbi:MAG: helix-turn-helix domain-containing protein [Bacteroidota bacterium]